MPTTRSVIVRSLFGVVGFSVLAIAAGSPPEFELLMSKDATNIQRHSFVENGITQLNYVIGRPYPQFAIADDQYAQLAKMEWKECTGQRNKWSSFIDGSQKATQGRRCVYGASTYFVKGAQMLSVLQERQSKLEGAYRCPVAPDNNEIAVTIVINIYETEKQLKQLLRDIGRTCE